MMLYMLMRARNEEEEKSASNSSERRHQKSFLLIAGRRQVVRVIPVFLFLFTVILSIYYDTTAYNLFGIPITGEQAVATLIAVNDANEIPTSGWEATVVAENESTDWMVSAVTDDDASPATNNRSSQEPWLSNNETYDTTLTKDEWLNVVPKRLRIYEKQTGVVLFYHIPKTGGVTVQSNLFPNIKKMTDALEENKDLTDFDSLRVVFWNSHGGKIVSLIESILSGERRQLLFVELHGEVPGLETLHPEMKKLRKLSLQTGVPFFTFTLLREPVSFHVSYFKFFHLLRCTAPWCEYDRHRLSDQAILKTAVPNKQCYILTHGQFEIKSRDPHSNLTAADCRRAYELLREDYDFVGSTDELSTVGMPLLTSILFGKPTASVGNNRVNEGIMADYHIRAATKATLLNVSGWDVEMYNAIRSGVPPTISD